MKKIRRGQFDPSFSNATLEEMAALVQQRGQKTDRRNRIILLLFFVLLVLALGISINVYDHWLVETFHALGQMVSAIWHWQWWEAGAILLQYKLSFFFLGLIFGFIIALFIVLQIVETLIDWVQDTLSSLFS
jgi:hypothetical protein